MTHRSPLTEHEAREAYIGDAVYYFVRAAGPDENLASALHRLNAQDRLIDGGCGVCVACGERINEQRLLADPAASMCFDCQRIAEGEMLCRTL